MGIILTLIAGEGPGISYVNFVFAAENLAAESAQETDVGDSPTNSDDTSQNSTEQNEKSTENVGSNGNNSSGDASNKDNSNEDASEKDNSNGEAPAENGSTEEDSTNSNENNLTTSETGPSENLNEEVDYLEDKKLYIRAINPGYKVEDKKDVGELIEIARGGASDDPISLAGITVDYTNSSGTTTTLVEFPENSYLVGEAILLRLASSSGGEPAAETYEKTLALSAGPLELVEDGEIIDSVCWLGEKACTEKHHLICSPGADGCAKKFDSKTPTTLVFDAETGEYVHVENYEPDYDPESYVIYVDDDASEDEKDPDLDPEPDPATPENSLPSTLSQEQSSETPSAASKTLTSQCETLQFSEILSYYTDSQSEQFIEFYNSGLEKITLNGCQIKYKNKFYALEGTVNPKSYFVRYATDFKLTKNPTTINSLSLIDTTGDVVATLDYPNGQKKGTSYAFMGYDEDGEENWEVSYMITPGAENVYQEFRACEEGKVINEQTGNCVKVAEEVEKVCAEGQYLNPETNRCKKIEEEKVEKTCAEGQYLNPETNRCKKIETTTEKVCEEGKYLNPLTNRCKKIETDDDTVKTCKEGYELNPETNRCKKVKTNDGTDYALVPETYKEESNFIALYIVLAIVAVGIIYVVFEFRTDIAKFFKKLTRKK